MSFRKRANRQYIDAIAELSGANNWKPTFCTILDLSVTGAKVQVPVNYKFPLQVFFKRIATGEIHEVRLIWRKYDTAGVRFMR